MRYNKLRLGQLRELCLERNLKTEGRKAVLVQRLTEFDAYQNGSFISQDDEQSIANASIDNDVDLDNDCENDDDDDDDDGDESWNFLK